MLKREGRNRINTSAQNKLWGVKCEQARCIGCAIDTDRSLYPCLSRPVSDWVERKTLLCPAKSKLYNQKTRKIAHPTKIQTFHFLNKMSTNLLNTKFNTCKILLQTKVHKLYPKNAKHLPNYLFSKCAKKFTLNLRLPREASQILSSFNGNTY